MKKFVALLVVILFAAACQGLTPKTIASSTQKAVAAESKGQRCADLMAQAILAQAPVAGSYDCLNANERSLFAFTGLSEDDAGLYSALKDSETTRIVYVGATGDGGFVYLGLGHASGTYVQIVWTDGDGKVSSLEFAAHP